MTTDVRQTVVLGVTGCIAAYKACELVRELVKDGVRVKVVMTEAATHFVGPATFRALTGEPVATSLWADPGEATVFHTSLAEEADVFAVVPATANVIAKIAHGRADDLLTTTALATEAPLIIAPAMNVHMWRAEPTRANIEIVRARGVAIVEPESGELACGDIGEGRLAPVSAIADAIRRELSRSCDLGGTRLLVTAGPTFEPIDPVRYIGNRSSGKTGYAIAEEAARRGAEVTLVSGPTSLPDPFGCTTIRVETAAQMHRAAMESFEAADAVIASAAVADFRPAAVSDHKLKKGSQTSDQLPLERTLDILAEMGSRKGQRILIGFAAESHDPRSAAKEKLARKSLDMVVANDITEPGLGFASDSNRVVFVDAATAEEMPVMTKRQLAREICDRLARLSTERGFSHEAPGQTSKGR